MKAVYLSVFSASTDNCRLYILYPNFPAEKIFIVQFITVKDNHPHPYGEQLLLQATTIQILASVNSNTYPLSSQLGPEPQNQNSTYTWEPPRAASILSWLCTQQAGSTTNSSPKHLFPQASSFQKGLVTYNREFITAPEMALLIQACSVQKFQSNQSNKTPYLNRDLCNREFVNHGKRCIYLHTQSG